MKRGKINIKFGAAYSEEEKKDIVSVLSDQFEVSVDKYVIIHETFPEPLLIVITLVAGISLGSFLTSFFGEAGKLLARRLFSSSKKDGKIVNLQIRYVDKQGEKRSFVVSAESPQKLLKNLKEINQSLNKDYQNENKKSTKI